MIRNRRAFLIFLISTPVVFLTTCIQDDLEKLQKSNWEPEFAFSLVDSRFEIDRIIQKFDTEGFLTTDNQDVITVVYKGQVFTVKADEAIKLNDITVPLAQVQHLGDVPISHGAYLLKSIDFDQCNLEVEIQDGLKDDIRVTLNMPKTTLNSVPFNKTFDIRFKGGSGLNFDTIFDISGYQMDLSGSGNERNKLKIKYSAVSLSNGDSVQIDKFDVTFRDISFLFLDGYFGKFQLGSHLDSIRLNMFENFKSGSITLEDPRFKFDIANSFGIPVHMSFGNFDGSGHGGNSSLDGTLIDQGIDVNTPSGTGGQNALTKKELDSSNSNIRDFLTVTPSALKFSFDMEANTSNDTNSYNFVRNTSELTCDLSLNIPLKGNLDSVIIEDYYELKAEELKGLDSATFKLVTNNSFPLGIYVQIYFLDKKLTVLDSLISDNDVIFKEAITDDDGFSITPMYEESYFTIGRARFDSIKNRATMLKIRVMLLTHEGSKKSIKITSHDYFDLKLAVRAALKL